MKKFLCLFVVVFGLFASFSPKSHAQATYATNNYGGILSQQNGDNSNTIDQTMTAFENATQEWQSVFTKYAKELFWILAPIGMVWRFGQIALKGEGLTEALAELVRFTIFIGFYYWLLENGTAIAQAIVHSMEKMAGTAAHTSQGLDASSILNLGLSILGDILYNNYKIFSLNEGHDFGAVFDVALGIFFACLCAVIAIYVLLAVLAVWFLMYVGIFILGFGSTSWTSDMAINYFRTVLAASLMAQRETAKAEERARAAKVAYPKAGSTANNSPTTSSARTYIVENMSEKEKEAMYHIPASQIYIPPPGYIGDRSDVGGPKPS